MGLYYLGNEVTVYYTFTVDGVPMSPTTVTFTVELPDETTETFVSGVDPEVTNPSVGVYELAYMPLTSGVYNYKVEGEGAVVAVSPTASFTVLSDAIAAGQGAPCEPWVTADDVAACCGVETTSTFLFDSVAYQAGALLFQLSARQFPGVCSKTVRPACDECSCGYQVLSRGHIVGPWDWGYSGFCGSCLVACHPSRIKLSGYPVREITQIKINGAVLASSEYRLWKNRYVTRLDNGRWPIRQNLTLADTEDNTFSISYLYGAEVPDLGRAAAASLACELYKACEGQECALPTGVTRLQRQGVTIELQSFTSWAYQRETRVQRGGWQTGMPLVDAFLNAYSPRGLLRRPVFWAPGRHQYAQPWG